MSFMRSFVGKNIEAITLNVNDASHTEALTDNYLKLRFKRMHKPNQWLHCYYRKSGERSSNGGRVSAMRMLFFPGEDF